MCTWVAWLESRGGLGETVSDVELSAGIRDGCWGEKRGGRGDVGVRDEGVWLRGRWIDIKGPAVEDSTGAVPAERINELIRLLARPTVPGLCTRRGRAPAHGKKGAQGGLVAVVELEVGAAVGMLVVVVGVVVEGGRSGREEDSGGDERPPPRKFPLRNARLGESGAPRCCAWSFLPAPRPLRARRCQQPRRPSLALYSLAVRPLPGLIYYAPSWTSAGSCPRSPLTGSLSSLSPSAYRLSISLLVSASVRQNYGQKTVPSHGLCGRSSPPCRASLPRAVTSSTRSASCFASIYAPICVRRTCAFGRELAACILSASILRLILPF